MDYEAIANSIRKNWKDTNWWRSVVAQFAVENAVVKPYFQYEGNDGFYVMDEDWDNLLILDACRYDMFEQQHSLPGTLESRVSRGSNTPEFLRENFEGKTFEDTVYVTANPQINVRLPSGTFHDVVSVWRDHWDDELNTVPPEVMSEEVRKAAERYPDKRLVAHYVQPHYPFVGPTGQAMGAQAGMELSKRMADGDSAEQDEEHVWDKLKRGKVDTATVWEAYRENLDIALESLPGLIDDLDGTTVVTSDHGNLLGEHPEPCPVPMGLYGHPEGVYSEHLVKVPWLVIEGAERKEVVAEASTDSELVEGTEERLKDLGYL